MYFYRIPVEMMKTGLVVHHLYLFIPAALDYLVVQEKSKGPSEVKGSLSKRGMKVEDAYKGKQFRCCTVHE